MKKGLIIILLFMLFVLVGCDTHKEGLVVPTGLRVEYDILYWNEVDYASKYRVKIGDYEYSTVDTYYSLEVGVGEYMLSVKAVGDGVLYESSDWSEEFAYTKTNSNDNPIIEGTALTQPVNLKVVDEVLSWDGVTNATKYKVRVNDNEYDVNQLTYVLDLEEGQYDLSIKAIGNGKEYLDSDWSVKLLHIVEGKTPSEDIVAQQVRYLSKPVKDNVKYVYSQNIEGVNLYYFYLGVIDNVPITHTDAYMFQFNNTDLQLSDSTTFTEDFSESQSVSEKITESTNKTFAIERGFKQSVSVEIPTLIKGEVENYLKFTGTVTTNLGSSVEHSNSRAYEYGKSSTYMTEVAYRMSTDNGFKIGRYYRLSRFSTLDAYVIIQVDPDTKDYVIEYQYYARLDNLHRVMLEESNENGDFINTQNQKLSFDYESAFKKIEELGELEKTPTKIDQEGIDKGFSGGNGTEAFPFLIGGGNGYNQLLNVNKYPSANFALISDIDVSSYNDPQKSLINEDFKGVFDGRNFTIRNLKYALTYSNTREQRMGLFKCNLGIIKNLKIDNFDITFAPNHSGDAAYKFGLLVGYGTGLIDKIEVTNSNIKIERNKANYGLIAGIYNGRIENITIKNSKVAGNGDGGGITGILDVYGIVKNCSIDGLDMWFYEVKENKCSTGGFVGYSKGTIEACIIINSNFELANVNGDAGGWFGIGSWHSNPKIGIIVGHVDGGNIWEVGSENISKKRSAKFSTDYYFKLGWGWGGKADNANVK